MTANDLWLIEESALTAKLDAKVKAKSGGVNALSIADIFNGRKPLQIQDGVAVIHVSGALSRNIAPIENALGDTGYEQITAELSEAVANPAVNAILLNIDSPGGAVVGCQECADAVKMASQSKPVVAFTDTMMASAAYWIGSAADAVYATKSALVGSIGVIARVVDISGMLNQNGIKVENFTPDYADLKGAGDPATGMTRAQRNWYQSFIEDLGAAFKGAVVENRGEVPDSAMRGQVLTGEKAKAANLVDEVAGFQDAFTDAMALAYTRKILKEAGGAS
jgi:signal peptide peptidase SppA